MPQEGTIDVRITWPFQLLRRTSPFSHRDLRDQAERRRIAGYCRLKWEFNKQMNAWHLADVTTVFDDVPQKYPLELFGQQLR